MYKPRGLAEAYSLVKLQDITVRALGGRAKAVMTTGANAVCPYSSNKSLAVTATTFKPSGSSSQNLGRDNQRQGNMTLGPKLSNHEMDENRTKGQCFRCARRKTFSIHMIEEVDEGEIEEMVGLVEDPDEAGEDALQLSLHALCGKNGPQIMRIKGTCQRRMLRVLIDSGSTHNFLNEHLAGRLKCKLSPVTPRSVEIANGQLLHCSHKC